MWLWQLLTHQSLLALGCSLTQSAGKRVSVPHNGCWENERSCCLCSVSVPFFLLSSLSLDKVTYLLGNCCLSWYTGRKMRLLRVNFTHSHACTFQLCTSATVSGRWEIAGWKFGTFWGLHLAEIMWSGTRHLHSYVDLHAVLVTAGGEKKNTLYDVVLSWLWIEG